MGLVFANCSSIKFMKFSPAKSKMDFEMIWDILKFPKSGAAGFTLFHC